MINKMRDEIIAGLRAPKKALPAKYFYDEKGAKLFEEICKVPEYYLTRTEISILETHIQEIVSAIGENAVLVELGSGASIKTEILLKHLVDIRHYVPMDICSDYLATASARLKQRFPHVSIIPLCKDFMIDLSGIKYLDELSLMSHANNIAFFPGSTLGNFTKEEAQELLRNVAKFVGTDGKLLIGVDSVKDPNILERAYNDERGVTRDFNLNLLSRINRELDADFNLNFFEHRAHFNQQQKRIEMHLICLEHCRVTIDGEVIFFDKGETIHTENSYKYTAEEFISLAHGAGFRLVKCWTDPKNYFNVFLLERIYSA